VGDALEDWPLPTTANEALIFQYQDGPRDSCPS
jgi:hypothetical protein